MNLPTADAPRAVTSTEFSGRRRWLKLTMKVLVFVVVLVATGGYLRQALSDLSDVEFIWRPGWLAVAGVSYLVGLLPCAWFWRRLLVLLGQPIAWRTLLRAYYIGHLGKYVPGKALVVVLRCALVHRPGMNPVLTAATTLYETLGMMAIGAGLAALLVAIGFREHAWFAICSALGAIVVGVPILPPVFRAILLRTGVGKRDPAVAERLTALKYRAVAGGAAGIAAGWWLIGLSLWATLRGMGADHVAGLSLWPLCTATVCIAVAAGFLSLIPGGAGIREFVLTALLTPVIGAAMALAAAVLLRLVWLVSELAISGILYAAGRQPPEEEQPAVAELPHDTVEKSA